MLLDPNDELSEIIPLGQAAAAAGVNPRTVHRWVTAGHLKLIPNMPGKWTTKRAVLECERDRHVAAHSGRPGARVQLG